MRKPTIAVLVTVAVALALGGCVVAGRAAGRTRWHQLSDEYSFEQYTREYHKVYADETEHAMRRAIFEAKLANILAHNRRHSSWKMGVNQFTDRTDEEFRKLLGYRKELAFAINEREGRHMAPASADQALLSSLPATIDWRDQGVVSDVKDQGVCGSCWTFATSETVESYWALASGELAVLSEQQIASCTPNPNDCGGTGGCGGGIPEIAYQNIQDVGGLSSEWTYPYLSYQGKDFPCRFSTHDTPPIASLSGYVKLAVNNYTAVMDAVASVGPLAVNVDASAWSSYESGVFTGCDMQAPDLDHVVQLVGYGTDAGSNMDYWLVRNSWAPSWGEDGYIRIYRDSTASTCGVDTTPQDGTGCNGGPKNVTVCGSCGILYDVTYPLIA